MSEFPNKKTQFKSGNPGGGRPRKTINSVNKELEEQGIKPTTANEIKDIYLRLVNMEMTELKALVENQKQPALIRIVGKKILSEKGFDIIEKMLDRSIGRATQQINVNDITPVIEVTEQQKKAIDNL